MPADLFDMQLRALRRDRAAAKGAELFLLDRAFEDCLERIALNNRRFQSCLLIGCPDAGWPAKLNEAAASVVVVDPGRSFADVADGTVIVEDRWDPAPCQFDLCVAIGTLDSINDLPKALQSIRLSLKPDSLLIGAMAGGQTLPQLRMAMHAADRLMGAASPRVHPRIEAAALAPLLSACGFVQPVVDVDRVPTAYRSFDRLIGDLRSMGATNILRSRSRGPLSREAKAAADAAFADAGENGRTVEIFEILHFAAWTPPD